MHTDNKTNAQQTDAKNDLLLELCKVSELELDYEYIESLSEPHDATFRVSSVESKSAVALHSVCPTYTETVTPKPRCSKDTPKLQQTTINARSNALILEMLKAQRTSIERGKDILDLHRMAEKFAEANNKRQQELANSVHKSDSEFEYGKVIGVDKLLEESHIICDRFQNKLGCDTSTRARLLKLITDLKKLPHLYQHKSRQKGKSAHVLDWLNNNTRPEPDMVGFTEKDPVKIRKFVSDTKPRLSTSETNITLGKRKRGHGDRGNCDVSVHQSCSDTKVFVHANRSMENFYGKRRRVLD